MVKFLVQVRPAKYKGGGEVLQEFVGGGGPHVCPMVSSLLTVNMCWQWCCVCSMVLMCVRGRGARSFVTMVPQTMGSSHPQPLQPLHQLVEEMRPS